MCFFISIVSAEQRPFSKVWSNSSTALPITFKIIAWCKPKINLFTVVYADTRCHEASGFYSRFHMSTVWPSGTNSQHKNPVKDENAPVHNRCKRTRCVVFRWKWSAPVDRNWTLDSVQHRKWCSLSAEVRGAWGKHTCEELEVGAVITEQTPMELNMTNMHMLFSLQSLHSLAQSIWHKFPFLEVTVGLVLCKLIDSFDSFVQALVMTGNIECCI